MHEDKIYQEPVGGGYASGPTMSSKHQEEIINTKAFLDRAVSRRREGEWKPMQPRAAHPIAPNGEIAPRKPRQVAATNGEIAPRAWTSPVRVNQQEPARHAEQQQREQQQLAEKQHRAEQQRAEAQQLAEEQHWAAAQQLAEEQHLAEEQKLAEQQQLAEEQRLAEEMQRAEAEANQLFDRHDPVPPISDIPVDDEPEWANLPHQRIEIPEWADKVAPNADLPCVDATIEGKNVIKQAYVPTSDYTVWTTETDDYATDPFAGAPFGAAAASMHTQYDYGPSQHYDDFGNPPHHDDFGPPPCDEYGNPYFDDFGNPPHHDDFGNPRHHDDFGSPHHNYHNRPMDDSYYDSWSNSNQHARP
jgi:hypothetical protein